MIKKLKKGFTLVELIVVIAIIAILSTVAVVSYTRVVDKANVSNDTQLVRNLNERMQLEEAATGYKKPKTAHEAFLLTEDFGYVIEKLTPTSSGNDIVWDSTTNRFALIDAEVHTKVVYSDPTKDLSENPINLWKVFKEVPSDPKYSIYLAGENFTSSITTSVGLDVGKNLGITEINYTNKSVNAKNVVIRTNSFDTVITVTAFESGTFGSDDYKCDSIRHFGDAKEVNIIKAGQASYHEYGVVLGNVYLEQGRFVAENGSDVSNVVVTATTTENVKVENSSTKTLNVSATNQNVVDSLGDITTGETSNQTAVVDEDTLKSFAGGLGTETSPYLISNESEFMNIAIVSNTNNAYYKLCSSFTLTKVLTINSDFSTYLDLDNYRIDLDVDGSIELDGEAILTLKGENSLVNLLETHNSGKMFITDGNSTLNIESGRYNSGIEVVLADKSSKVNIYGGTFSTFAIWNGIYWVLNLQDETEAQITVYGGTFINYNPAESHTEDPVANFVAEGYEVIVSGQTSETFVATVQKIND